MRHYAVSVPKPKPKEIPTQDLTSILRLPGAHILPPIMEHKSSSYEKIKKMEFDHLE
jgi:hypothetical protein